MQIVDSLEEHLHVALDMRRLEDDALLHQDRLKIGFAELEDKIQVLVNEEHIHQLPHKYEKQAKANMKRGRATSVSTRYTLGAFPRITILKQPKISG